MMEEAPSIAFSSNPSISILINETSWSFNMLSKLSVCIGISPLVLIDEADPDETKEKVEKEFDIPKGSRVVRGRCCRLILHVR